MLSGDEIHEEGYLLFQEAGKGKLLKSKILILRKISLIRDDLT